MNDHQAIGEAASYRHRHQVSEINPLTLISMLVLGNHHVLDLLWGSPFHAKPTRHEQHAAVFAGFQPWAARWPDHVFESHWDALHAGDHGHDWLLAALAHGADLFLHEVHGDLRVRNGVFALWQQDVVSRVSGLPLAAAWAGLVSPNPGLNERHQRPYAAQSAARTSSPLLIPHDPVVEDYLQREGLHDTHRHLNGSTFAEACWLQALRTPHTEAARVSQALCHWQHEDQPDEHKGRKVQELGNAISPGFTALMLYERLRCAVRLREWLLGLSTHGWCDALELPLSMAELDEKPCPWSPPHEYALAACLIELQREREWMTTLLTRLRQAPHRVVTRMLHLYLLLFNQFYRLQVQSAEQYGFDQFQRLTFVPLRHGLEEGDYLRRFWAAHGGDPKRSVVRCMEGRFAPKVNLDKNMHLLKRVLRDYWAYLRADQPPSPMSAAPAVAAPWCFGHLLRDLEQQLQSTTSEHKLRLALVAHFIKKPWSSKKPGQYRHHPLRTELERSANALLQTLSAYPRLGLWLRGVDAASNELDADPEVFAHVFQACLDAGLTHRTFHVGEDFRHLLGGLRVMHDALDLLKLRAGDRIGHGTAMGIAPSLWLSRSPPTVRLSKGAWLLDLLIIGRELGSLPGFTFHAQQVQRDIANLSRQIFSDDIAIETLRAAMDLRHLNAKYLHRLMQDPQRDDPAKLVVSPIWRRQAQQVTQAHAQDPKLVTLLWRWWSDREVWQRSNVHIEVEADYFSDGGATMVALQQSLMHKVNRLDVVIECLPSSNVRISSYQHLSEHHALRWMRVDSHLHAGDPPIRVSLGSDDPGIFGCDMPGEFYQLYLAARDQGLSASDALSRVGAMNETGRTHRFHSPTL